MRPVDGVPLDEAALILGCSLRQTARYIETGRLPAAESHARRTVSRADAEALALQLPSSLVPVDPATSYWCGTREAAQILGVNVSRVGQLVESDRIPCERHVSGRRMFRREQLRTVANAREARWHS